MKWLILTLNTIMTKKCLNLKHHIYLFYGLLIYLIDSSLLWMFTHEHIALFSCHAFFFFLLPMQCLHLLTNRTLSIPLSVNRIFYFFSICLIQYMIVVSLITSYSYWFLLSVLHWFGNIFNMLNKKIVDSRGSNNIE